mgnify:CR=1 FL=1
MKPVILVLEDEPPVRTALARDLAPFAGAVQIEMAEDVEDAKAVIDEATREGNQVALILADHRLPGTTGVDFLVESMKDPRVAGARRVLVTGQAGQADTIRAVNDGHISHYISKPWEAENLQDVVRGELTEYVLDNDVPPLPLMAALDQPRVMRALAQTPGGLTT